MELTPVLSEMGSIGDRWAKRLEDCQRLFGEYSRELSIIRCKLGLCGHKPGECRIRVVVFQKKRDNLMRRKEKLEIELMPKLCSEIQKLDRLM